MMNRREKVSGESALIKRLIFIHSKFLRAYKTSIDLIFFF